MNALKITALLVGAVIFLPGCFRAQDDGDISNFTARNRHTTIAFGTVSVLRLYADFSQEANAARFDRVWDEAREILRELDSVFSVTNPASDVARFNALPYGESIEISGHMARVMKIAAEVYEKLGGLFDPTVFPLVDLWGFSPRFRLARFAPLYPFDRPRWREQPPAPEYIEAFRHLAGFGGVVLGGCQASGFTLANRIPPVVVNGVSYQARLDLGAIVKGYAADLVREAMIREGFRFGFFSCGGSSMALLNGMDYASPDGGAFHFRLRLRKPRPGQTQESAFMAVMVSGTNLSTSGDYDHAFFLDGIRYSHIIDPRTGRPVNTPPSGAQSGFAAATVLGGSGAFAEGLSTGLLMKTLSEAVSFINRLENHKVVLVYYKAGIDFFEIITNIPDELITILDPAYVMGSRLDAYGKVEYIGTLYRSAP